MGVEERAGMLSTINLVVVAVTNAGADRAGRARASSEADPGQKGHSASGKATDLSIETTST